MSKVWLKTEFEMEDILNEMADQFGCQFIGMLISWLLADIYFLDDCLDDETRDKLIAILSQKK